MRLSAVRIAQWICCLLGHKMVPSDGSADVAGAHRCTRCGIVSPAIDWDKLPQAGYIFSSSALTEAQVDEMVARFEHMLPSRQAPPMPECKPYAHRISVEDELRWLKIVMQLTVTCQHLEAEA